MRRLGCRVGCEVFLWVLGCLCGLGAVVWDDVEGRCEISVWVVRFEVGR